METSSPQEMRLLDLCRDIELAGEALYLYFAELFKDDAPIEALWRKTAEEERNHANQFALAARIRTGMIESVNLDLAEAEEALAFIQGVQHDAQRNPPTVAAALRAAIRLEEKLSKFHMDCLVSFTEEAHREMFKAMMDADVRHEQALRDAYLKLAGAPEGAASAAYQDAR